MSFQLWASFDPEAEAATNGHSNGSAAPVSARKEYVDVVVSDVRGGGETPFSFAVQILANGGAYTVLSGPETAADHAHTTRHPCTREPHVGAYHPPQGSRWRPGQLCSEIERRRQRQVLVRAIFSDALVQLLTIGRRSADDTWYRARIRKCNPAKKEAEVLYIDCELFVRPQACPQSAEFDLQTETRRRSPSRASVPSRPSSRASRARPRRRLSHL